jgi:hypothetical protein
MTPIVSARKWVCPECHRCFAKPNQSHSCDVREIGTHFKGKKADMRPLFDRLVDKLKRKGPLRVDAVKTSIHLVSRFHFGGIRVREGYLRIGFLMDRAIESPRVVSTLVLGPRRIEHEIVIRSEKDLDGELLGWLAASQALQA